MTQISTVQNSTVRQRSLVQLTVKRATTVLRTLKSNYVPYILQLFVIFDTPSRIQNHTDAAADLGVREGDSPQNGK